MNVNDIALQNSLEDWREKTAIQMYGAANFREYGAGLIMSNTVLDRIVLCGHSKKLKTGADLSQETRWTLATKYAEEILALVHRHTVPTPCAPAFTHIPLQRVNGPSAAGAPIANQACSLTAKRTNKCGACGALGHICESFSKHCEPFTTTCTQQAIVNAPSFTNVHRRLPQQMQGRRILYSSQCNSIVVRRSI